jgi:hypothetical protein
MSIFQPTAFMQQLQQTSGSTTYICSTQLIISNFIMGAAPFNGTYLNNGIKWFNYDTNTINSGSAPDGKSAVSFYYASQNIYLIYGKTGSTYGWFWSTATGGYLTGINSSVTDGTYYYPISGYFQFTPGSLYGLLTYPNPCP